MARAVADRPFAANAASPIDIHFRLEQSIPHPLRRAMQPNSGAGRNNDGNTGPAPPPFPEGHDDEKEANSRFARATQFNRRNRHAGKLNLLTRRGAPTYWQSQCDVFAPENSPADPNVQASMGCHHDFYAGGRRTAVERVFTSVLIECLSRVTGAWIESETSTFLAGCASIERFLPTAADEETGGSVLLPRATRDAVRRAHLLAQQMGETIRILTDDLQTSFERVWDKHRDERTRLATSMQELGRCLATASYPPVPADLERLLLHELPDATPFVRRIPLREWESLECSICRERDYKDDDEAATPIRTKRKHASTPTPKSRSAFVTFGAPCQCRSVATHFACLVRFHHTKWASPTGERLVNPHLQSPSSRGITCPQCNSTVPVQSLGLVHYICTERETRSSMRLKSTV